MPVQFLSGGGGGTSDVRESFAAPVLTDCPFTNTQSILSPVKWTIPANYLQVNDTLCCSVFLDVLTGNTTSKITRAWLRLGTTGSNTDTLLGQVDVYMANTANLPEPTTSLKGFINVKSTGSGGTCIGNITGIDSSGSFGSGVVSNGLQTIDTSAVLYLTIWLQYVTGSSTSYATLSAVGSSICVSF